MVVESFHGLFSYILISTCHLGIYFLLKILYRVNDNGTFLPSWFVKHNRHIQTQERDYSHCVKHVKVLSYQIITHVTGQLDVSAGGQNFTLMQMEP